MAYGYRVTLKSTGDYYIGIRTAKNCEPSDLWNTYFTSSKIIKKLIEQNGTDAFDIEILTVFEDPTDAPIWENIVLCTHIGLQHCLNQAVGGVMFLTEESFKRAAESRTGMKFSAERNAKLSATKKQQWEDPEFRIKMLSKRDIQNEKLKEHWKNPEWRATTLKNKPKPPPESAIKATEAVRGTIWITDGITDKRVKIDCIPSGWTKGRSHSAWNKGLKKS